MGSSNHTTPPIAGIVRSYVNCQQKHVQEADWAMWLYVKSIANTRDVASWKSAHETAFFRKAAMAVDGTTGQEVGD